MWFLSCVLGFLVAVIIYSLKRDPEPIFGVYMQPGKWYPIKYVVFLCIYYFRKYNNSNKAVESDSGRAGQGVKAIADPVDMDRAQVLSDDAKAFDAVFFISSTANKEDKGIYVIAGCERRQMGICSGLFYIGLPGKGLLCSKKIPDTLLFGAEVGQFGAEGILMKPVEPMKRWTVSYKGQMWYQNDPETMLDVEFEGEWTAKWKHFDYDTELHPPAVARSVALQPWSKEYFETLKTAHQSHYEQFGVMDAKFTIAGESYHFELPSFRDHSFGHKRDWTLMHRYAFHHIFLENNTCISVGVICQPATTTLFEAGVVCLSNGEVHPVKWCDLKLYQHGEKGTPPKEYAFRIQAADVIYTIQVFVEYESTHFVSADWDARMVERFCKFVVNGVPGRGVSEFHYNNTSMRPDEYADKDPEWYRKMCHKV